jgi:hypothetical protein
VAANDWDYPEVGTARKTGAATSIAPGENRYSTHIGAGDQEFRFQAMALAHLGVARANALETKTSQGADADAARVRALASYKGFLALWKDADPEIPILKQAKAEYAKLQ